MVGATIYKNAWVSSSEDWDKPKEHYVADTRGALINTAALTEGFMSRLRKQYEFRGELIVESFLQENSFLGNLLSEAHEEIRDHFGFGVRPALEVVVDAEALGDQQLFIVIRTKFPPKVARAHLAELDRDWWLGALPRAGGKVEIATERI